MNDGTPDDHRRELLRRVLRDTLLYNGIPGAWVTAEGLRTSTGTQEPGIHLRFHIRHWDPRLLVHSLALQEDFLERLLAVDAEARVWLRGFSWQYGLPAGFRPAPLPPPESWGGADGRWRTGLVTDEGGGSWDGGSPAQPFAPTDPAPLPPHADGT